MIFRPPSSFLLPVPHVQQHADGECLAASVAMCLSYLQNPVRYERLLKTLLIQSDVGTAFSNIRNLEKLKIGVNYRRYGTLEELYRLLSGGWPCIVSIQTQELAYWNGTNVYHAVVVAGMDQNSVFLHDPALPAGPIDVTLGEFDLAWLAQDETYAILAPSTSGHQVYR